MQDEINEVEQELADLEKQQAECLARIRALREEEDAAKGVFRNQEIHEAQQEKIRLDFDIQYRKSKIKNRKLQGQR